MKRLFGILLFSFAVLLTLTGQIPDSIPVQTNLPDSTMLIAAQDSVAAIVKTDEEGQKFLHFLKKEDGLPNPKTALILSLVVPGAGQIYNGKWWKAPFVYAALGGLAYAIDFNTNEYLVWRTAYKRKVQDLPHRFSGSNVDNAATLKSRRDAADKNRQLSYFGFAAVWLVGGAEAFVNAHLLNFDVSDDLSMKIQPSFELTPTANMAAGVGLSFQWNTEKEQPKIIFP